MTDDEQTSPYSILPHGRWARRAACPVCHRRSVLLSWFTDWFGCETTCLRCGESFQGEESLPRPFARDWRTVNKTRARARWRQAPLPGVASNDPVPRRSGRGLMTAYVDDAAILFRGKLRYHMSADSLAELHGFAALVGIKRCWYHVGSRYPHYDITGPQRSAAIVAGARLVEAREMAVIAKKLAPARKAPVVQLSLPD